MTDKYGSEAEGHEPGTEHDPVAAPDSWQGDQPPVDDFADPEHGEAEGPATVSEEAEADAIEAPVDESLNPPKKSSNFPMLIGVIGVIVIGGLVYFQFFGGAALLKSGSTMNVARGSKPLEMPSTVVPQIPAAPALAATSGANDIANLKPPSTALAPSGIAAPVQVPPIPPSGVAMPSPGSPQPPFPTAASPNAEAAPSFQPSAVPPLSAGSLETQVSLLSARVDALQKSLDQAGQQLNQLNGMVTALQAAPSIPPATAAMEEHLNKLEQDVIKLEQSPIAMAKPLPIPIAATKPVPSHHAKPKKAKPVQATSSATPRPVKKPAPAPAPSPAPITWILRAATPGEAWVSQGSNASVLQHIQVGDDLPGIGHVIAIKQDNGRWTIEGTKGTIE